MPNVTLPNCFWYSLCEQRLAIGFLASDLCRPIYRRLPDHLAEVLVVSYCSLIHALSVTGTPTGFDQRGPHFPKYRHLARLTLVFAWLLAPPIAYCRSDYSRLLWIRLGDVCVCTCTPVWHMIAVLYVLLEANCSTLARRGHGVLDFHGYCPRGLVVLPKNSSVALFSLTICSCMSVHYCQDLALD